MKPEWYCLFTETEAHRPGNQTYILSDKKLETDQHVELRDQLGFVERTKRGWDCAICLRGIKFFASEPSRLWAQKRVERELERETPL